MESIRPRKLGELDIDLVPSCRLDVVPPVVRVTMAGYALSDGPCPSHSSVSCFRKRQMTAGLVRFASVREVMGRSRTNRSYWSKDRSAANRGTTPVSVIEVSWIWFFSTSRGSRAPDLLAKSPFKLVLPNKLKTKLNDTGRKRAGDASKLSRLHGRVRVAKICEVEGVEELRAELEALVLSDCKRLVQ